MGQTYIKEKRIDGHLYGVRMLDPDTAVDMFVDLFDTIGEALSSIAGVDPDTEDEEGKAEAIATMLRCLVGKVDKAKLHDMIGKLVRVSDVDNKPLQPCYKIHFQGRIGHLAKWLVFALQVQYSDFSDVLGSIPTLGTRRPVEGPEGAEA